MKAANPDAKASRNTVQRALVLEAVRSLRNHPTSADVLAERGEVLRVEVPNGADRYDFFNQPHYHAKCRGCGRVLDVDMPYHADIADEVSDAHGFAIEGHQIVFTGLCADCRQADLPR